MSHAISRLERTLHWTFDKMSYHALESDTNVLIETRLVEVREERTFVYVTAISHTWQVELGSSATFTLGFASASVRWLSSPPRPARGASSLRCTAEAEASSAACGAARLLAAEQRPR